MGAARLGIPALGIALLVSASASAKDSAMVGATDPSPRAEVTFAASRVFFERSAYDRTLRAFDHEGMTDATTYALRALHPVRDWFRVGARLGLLHAQSKPQTFAGDARLPSDAITFDLFDATAVVRFVLRRKPTRGGFRFDVGLEGGFVLGSATMRGISQRVRSARGELSAFVGYEAASPGALLGARFGYGWLPWNGAGGSSFDPVFSGFFVAVEAGAVL